MSIERLAGPATHVCWTPDHVPRSRRESVSLVRENELFNLERFFGLPLHQQIKKMETATRRHIRENKLSYPEPTFLLNCAATLSVAHDLAFAYFAAGIKVEYVL